MENCHWHPERESAAQCDSCERHICASCATDVSEPPTSYQVCPECLESLEYIVERGLNPDGQEVGPWNPWLGAYLGAVIPMLVWIGALLVAPPQWYLPVRWFGYISIGLAGAFMAVSLNRNMRGTRVTIAAVCAVVTTIGIGHYITTNALTALYLSAQPVLAREFVRVGLISPDFGWWLPFGAVIRMLPLTTTWMDYGVMLASLYLAYALTHRRRLWKTRLNWFR